MEQDHKVLPSETRRLFALLKITRRPGLQTLAESPFRNIPPEILKGIVEYLPLASAASFALCCQPLAAALGSRHLRIWENRYEDKEYSDWHVDKPTNSEELMILLDRDLLDRTACFKCLEFHKNDEVHVNVPSNWHYLGPAPCWRHSNQEIPGLEWFEDYLLHHNFNIPVFQRAMRQHRQGLDCRAILQSLSLKTTSRTEPFGTMQHNSRPRIINDSMILRTQKAFLVTQLKFSPCVFVICPHSRCVTSDDIFGEQAVGWCQHIVRETVKYYEWTLLEKSKNAKDRRVAFDLLEVKKKINMEFAPGKLHQCPHCPTEFQIDFKEFEGYGVAIFITRWQDLGNGEDEKWQSQLVGPEGPTHAFASFEAGSICEAFEEKAPVEENELYDEWYLTHEDKKQLLRAHRDGSSYRDGVDYNGPRFLHVAGQPAQQINATR